MTSLDIPNFVLGCVAQELNNALDTILQDIACKYNLDYTELHDRYIGKKLNVITTKVSQVTIRVNQRKKEISEEERCLGRTWSQGRGLQCKKQRKPGSEFCCLHNKQAQEGRLKLGRITEKPPPEFAINPNTKKKLYI
jgi:hypothetical protein